MELCCHGGALLLMVCACSAASPKGGTDPASETGQDAAPAHESDRDRAIRRAKSKREQCDALADAVQGEQEGRHILNVNDSTALKAAANKLQAGAKHIDDVHISVDELSALRAEYTRLTRAKADAIRSATNARQTSERTRELGRYHQLDQQISDSIDSINAYCSAPVSE